MIIREAMTPTAEHIPPETSLTNAAKKMRELHCGFLPVSDDYGEKLVGVITDRDIAIRGVAEGKDPDEVKVREIMSEKVLYCYADDTLASAADSMGKKGVHRLIVLDDKNHKNLCGVLSLGDIFRHNEEAIGARIAKDIYSQAA